MARAKSEKTQAAGAAASDKGEARLERALPLVAFMADLLGVASLDVLVKRLHDVAEGQDDGEDYSHFCDALLVSHTGEVRKIGADKLVEYDHNIREYGESIGAKRGGAVSWKYFQWLALLFVEIYLDRYFGDKEGFKDELNAFLAVWRKRKGVWQGVADWRMGDMNKIAFWCATGAGKTLLMHANILQFRRYSERAGMSFAGELLITPNEGLTEQHRVEFALSGISAEPFRKDKGQLGFDTVQIIEISKLSSKAGEKTVAVSSFGDRNLVLVDEAHKGSGGDVWKKSRERLSEEGFSFEYSATIGQAVNSQGLKARGQLLDEYAKAVIIDYAYRRFYNDGYGKEYSILNLSRAWNERDLRVYLVACLLSFYEQLLVFAQQNEEADRLNVQKPLLVFVGCSVNAVRREGGKDTSDVLSILRFMDEFLRNARQSEADVACLLEGRDDLVDGEGRRVFASSFGYIKGKVRRGELTAAAVTEGMRRRIFGCPVAGSRLHIASVRGFEGQLALWAGQGDTFGVVNVGDEGRLLKLASSQGVGVAGASIMTARSPFESINESLSSVNVLIGSKKFTEGWNSWRVSAMGLMNVGRGEGSEIIQLFGRGVRLMGEGISLKRSSAVKGDTTSEDVRLLERLYVFGVRSDYMERFKEYLQAEGAQEEAERKVSLTIDVVRTVDLGDHKLKTLMTHDEAGFLENDMVTIAAPRHLAAELCLREREVSMDLRSRVLSFASDTGKLANASQVGKMKPRKLNKSELQVIDWGKLWFDLVAHKRQKGFFNAQVQKASLRAILEEGSWYELLLSQGGLWTGEYESTAALCQDVALRLLCSYMDRVYGKAKGLWMRRHTSVHYLDDNDANLTRHYTVAVKESETQLIDHIEKLKQLLQNDNFVCDMPLVANGFQAMYFESHLYKPLLSLAGDEAKVDVRPVPLNTGESRLVADIRDYYRKECEGRLKGMRLYLLRNESRKGIGFFEASNFYPDFVMWLVSGQMQRVAFIDPKGILHLKGLDDPKIELCKTIKDTQESLADTDLSLESFIISNTHLSAVDWWTREHGVGDEGLRTFNARHVYFQNEQQGEYVGLIVEAMMSG